MTRPRVLSALVAASLLALVAACGSSDDSGSSNPTVRVGSLPFAQYAAPAYESDKAIEKSIGLDIKVNQFSRAVDAIEALRAGRIDVTFGGIGTFIPTYLQGTKVHIVGSIGYGGYQLLRAKGEDINSYADLKGKKVGLTRGALEVLVNAALSDAGLTGSADDPDADTKLVLLPGTPDMNQALARGDVDAIFQSEPDATSAIEQGFGEAVKKPYDTSAGPITKVIMMSDKLYNDRARAVKYLEGIIMATNKLCSDPALRESYTRDDIFKGQLSSEDYKAATGNAPLAVDKATVDEVQANGDLLHKIGITDKDIDATKAVDLSLMKEALAKVPTTGEC
jgi:NitT/TauT family transport system substrate-binding protein